MDKKPNSRRDDAHSRSDVRRNVLPVLSFIGTNVRGSEHLKSVPDALESLILEKRLLQAAALLVRSLKLINKPDMQEIGAVSDLRSYLVGQETVGRQARVRIGIGTSKYGFQTLREILVDELHNHLYLKSFWCESRWTVYSPNQQGCQ